MAKKVIPVSQEDYEKLKTAGLHETATTTFVVKSIAKQPVNPKNSPKRSQPSLIKKYSATSVKKQKRKKVPSKRRKRLTQTEHISKTSQRAYKRPAQARKILTFLSDSIQAEWFIVGTVVTIAIIGLLRIL